MTQPADTCHSELAKKDNEEISMAELEMETGGGTDSHFQAQF